jgi:hypothetical protein
MKHKLIDKEDSDTTMWKSRKYFSDDYLTSASTSSKSRNSNFNYTNIQFPTLELFAQPTPFSSKIEPLTSMEDDLTNTDEVEPSKNRPNNFVDYEFIQESPEKEIGLNAIETRVDLPPVLPEETPVEPTLEEEEDTHDDSNGKKSKRNDNIKKCSIAGSWKTFTRDKTLKNAKKVAACIVDNVPEMFTIPEMISTTIVKNATDKSKQKGIDYAQNVLKVNAHFKSFIEILLCLYITFNWWYLMLYTNHYIDFYAAIKTPFFIPVIWIVGPLTTPLAALNYYLLGKRTEPEFYTKYVEPVLKKKSFYLSLLFISVVLLYEPLIQLFTTNMKDILGESNKTNPLVGIVIGTAVLSFLYSVVFNTERNIQFISTVSFLIAIVAYLIMFILVILLAKPVSVLVILYVVFYSFLFLLFAENINFVGKIIEMMSDTTEQCLDKPSQSTFSKLLNVCYRYSFFILVFIVLIARFIRALYDIRTITEERVRVSCYAIYLTLLLLCMLLFGYNFIDVLMNVKKIVTGEQTTDDKKDEFDTNEPDVSKFGKMIQVINTFGENMLLIVLILIEALKYIGIQLAFFFKESFMFLYRQSKNFASNMNLFGKTETKTVPSATPITTPTAPVNITT